MMHFGELYDFPQEAHRAGSFMAVRRAYVEAATLWSKNATLYFIVVSTNVNRFL